MSVQDETSNETSIEHQTQHSVKLEDAPALADPIPKGRQQAFVTSDTCNRDHCTNHTDEPLCAECKPSTDEKPHSRSRAVSSPICGETTVKIDSFGNVAPRFRTQFCENHMEVELSHDIRAFGFVAASEYYSVA